MSTNALEQTLRDLPRLGTLVKNRGYRQVWRFEADGTPLYLKFYPRDASQLKRKLRGSSAHLEFIRLQALQRAEIPAPRAKAELIGFNLSGVQGDAVILQAIEPSITLDQYVANYQQRGEAIPNHRDLVRRILDLLKKLGGAKLGHGDLHLGNLLLHEGQVYLLDAHGVRLGGLKMSDVLQLAHSVRGIATRTDLLRGWRALGGSGRMPARNLVSRRQWRKHMEKTRAENDYFGLLKYENWAGVFFKKFKFPRRTSPASELRISREDWDTAWPKLWTQIESNQLKAIKRSPSGDVLEGEVMLGGRAVPVIIKRPYKRYWYRYLNEIGRGSRAWRAWHKAWTVIWRGFPTAWPLMVLQKRRLGYITDAVVVFEKAAGQTLAAADLDALPPKDRDMLFRRTGGILKQIDDMHLSHFDAKASNWIVRMDDELGPEPILIDVDGVRFRRWRALGIERLLRSMREHPQYSRADSLALCQGYAPFSPTAMDDEENVVEQEDEVGQEAPPPE